MFRISQAQNFALDSLPVQPYSKTVTQDNSHNEDNEAFRLNLAKIRKSRGMSRKALALAAGMNKRAVDDIETGVAQSPKLSTALSLAKALDANLMTLLGHRGEHDLIQEWEVFLSKFDEDDQRKYLDAVQSLRALSGES